MDSRPFTPPFIAKDTVKQEKVSVGKELEYDDILQCYWDPKTKEYYQLSV